MSEYSDSSRGRVRSNDCSRRAEFGNVCSRGQVFASASPARSQRDIEGKGRDASIATAKRSPRLLYGKTVKMTFWHDPECEVLIHELWRDAIHSTWSLTHLKLDVSQVSYRDNFRFRPKKRVTNEVIGEVWSICSSVPTTLPRQCPTITMEFVGKLASSF